MSLVTTENSHSDNKNYTNYTSFVLCSAFEAATCFGVVQCENQNSTQQQEQERLQNYWQKRLAKMEQEYSKKHAKQTAESHTIREECSVAMSRVLPLLSFCQETNFMYLWALHLLI